MHETGALPNDTSFLRGNTAITSFDELKYFTNITYISNNTFDGCTNLESISIPSGVTASYENAFRNCSKLKKVHITDLSAWCRITFSGSGSNANPLTSSNGSLYLNG